MQVTLRHARLSELQRTPLLQARESAAPNALANMLERNLVKPIID